MDDPHGMVLLTQALPPEDQVEALKPVQVHLDVDALSISQQQLLATTNDLASRPNLEVGDEEAFKSFMNFLKELGFLVIKHTLAFAKQFAQVIQNRKKSCGIGFSI